MRHHADRVRFYQRGAIARPCSMDGSFHRLIDRQWVRTVYSDAWEAVPLGSFGHLRLGVLQADWH